jgi:hypothetical protein
MDSFFVPLVVATEELSPASSSSGYLSSMQEDAGIPSSFGDVRTDESIG